MGFVSELPGSKGVRMGGPPLFQLPRHLPAGGLWHPVSDGPRARRPLCLFPDTSDRVQLFTPCLCSLSPSRCLLGTDRYLHRALVTFHFLSAFPQSSVSVLPGTALSFNWRWACLGRGLHMVLRRAVGFTYHGRWGARGVHRAWGDRDQRCREGYSGPSQEDIKDATSPVSQERRRPCV